MDVNQVNSTTPIDFIKVGKEKVTENDKKLIKDLKSFGLIDGVIIVLLHYVFVISKIGLVHSLFREMGKRWQEENISTVEQALTFIRAEHKKYIDSTVE